MSHFVGDCPKCGLEEIELEPLDEVTCPKCGHGGAWWEDHTDDYIYTWWAFEWDDIRKKDQRQPHTWHRPPKEQAEENPFKANLRYEPNHRINLTILVALMAIAGACVAFMM